MLNKIDEQTNKELPISSAQMSSSEINNEKQSEDSRNEIQPVEDKDEFDDKSETLDEYKTPDKIDVLDGNQEKIEVEEMIQVKEVDLDTVKDRKLPKKEFQLPSPELLTNPISFQSDLSKDELVERANFLQQSLETFGVIGKVVNVSPGPVITLFEVEPAEGVRVNKLSLIHISEPTRPY